MLVYVQCIYYYKCLRENRVTMAQNFYHRYCKCLILSQGLKTKAIWQKGLVYCFMFLWALPGFPSLGRRCQEVHLSSETSYTSPEALAESAIQDCEVALPKPTPFSTCRPSNKAKRSFSPAHTQRHSSLSNPYTDLIQVNRNFLYPLYS